jgi:hypothetical protein
VGHGPCSCYPDPVYVVCSWCGVLMGVVPPLEDGRPSHGLCYRCAEQVTLEQFANVRTVIVVARTKPLLYESLRSAFESVPHVRVVLDQRRTERRTRRAATDREHRRQSRRRTWSKRVREAWRSLNVVVVHLP